MNRQVRRLENIQRREKRAGSD